MPNSRILFICKRVSSFEIGPFQSQLYMGVNSLGGDLKSDKSNLFITNLKKVKIGLKIQAQKGKGKPR